MTSSSEFAFETLEAPPPAPVPVQRIADPLRAAEAEADGIRAEARAEGYAEGRAEAFAAVQAEAATALGALGEALSRARALEAEAADRAERAAVELSLALAEKLLAGALDIEPERVLDVVRGALRGVVERARVTVLVNPDDMPVLTEAVGDLVRELGGIEHCEVQAERRVRRGGALVITPEGEVDARVETKLERAAELLRERPGS